MAVLNAIQTGLVASTYPMKHIFTAADDPNIAPYTGYRKAYLPADNGSDVGSFESGHKSFGRYQVFQVVTVTNNTLRIVMQVPTPNDGKRAINEFSSIRVTGLDDDYDVTLEPSAISTTLGYFTATDPWSLEMETSSLSALVPGNRYALTITPYLRGGRGWMSVGTGTVPVYNVAAKGMHLNSNQAYVFGGTNLINNGTQPGTLSFPLFPRANQVNAIDAYPDEGGIYTVIGSPIAELYYSAEGFPGRYNSGTANVRFYMRDAGFEGPVTFEFIEINGTRLNRADALWQGRINQRTLTWEWPLDFDPIGTATEILVTMDRSTWSTGVYEPNPPYVVNNADVAVFTSHPTGVNPTWSPSSNVNHIGVADAAFMENRHDPYGNANPTPTAIGSFSDATMLDGAGTSRTIHALVGTERKDRLGYMETSLALFLNSSGNLVDVMLNNQWLVMRRADGSTLNRWRIRQSSRLVLNTTYSGQPYFQIQSFIANQSHETPRRAWDGYPLASYNALNPYGRYSGTLQQEYAAGSTVSIAFENYAADDYRAYPHFAGRARVNSVGTVGISWATSTFNSEDAMQIASEKTTLFGAVNPPRRFIPNCPIESGTAALHAGNFTIAGTNMPVHYGGLIELVAFMGVGDVAWDGELWYIGGSRTNTQYIGIWRDKVLIYTCDISVGRRQTINLTDDDITDKGWPDGLTAPIYRYALYNSENETVGGSNPFPMTANSHYAVGFATSIAELTPASTIGPVATIGSKQDLPSEYVEFTNPQGLVFNTTTDGSGSGATLICTSSSFDSEMGAYRVNQFTLNSGGTGYEVGDSLVMELSLPFALNPYPSCTVDSVS